MEVEECRFESSHLLASLLTSTTLPLHAWHFSNLANTTPALPGYTFDCVGDVAYVAFSGANALSGDTHLVPIASAGDNNNNNNNTLFTSLAGADPPPMVCAGLLQLFLSVHNTPGFNEKMVELIENNKAVAFVGHAVGGAVASLVALSLLSSYPSIRNTRSLLCITFGSPLLGDEALSAAVLKQKWAHRFCHLVSTADPLPGSLLPPIINDGSLDRKIAQLCQVVADQSSSSYTPFGTFFFCSKERAVAVDNPVSVVQLLRYLASSSAISSSDHLDYGGLVLNISQQFLRRGRIVETTLGSSYDTSIYLAIEALGLKPQVNPVAVSGIRDSLKTAAQMGKRPNLKCAELAIGLAKVTPNRAQIEWYKSFCDDEGTSYYDSFKLRRNPKREAAVNIARLKLGHFWDRVIAMIDSDQLPHDFQQRAKWVNASHFYKLLVEPLDIADYYRSGKHKSGGHYMARGRPRRYRVFDRWWRERGWGGEERERTTLAGLTQDSCFWARVEEAKEWAAMARGVEVDDDLLGKMGEFDQYARGLVKTKQVSRDVLVEESSYVLWHRAYEEIVNDTAHPFFPQLPN